MTPEPTEIPLIERARRGGPDGTAAYATLIARHQVWLVRYLVYLCRDQGTAEDLAQDVLIRAHRGLPTYRGDASFRTWLRSIATRLAFNHRRDAATRVRYEQASDTSWMRPPSDAAVESREALLLVLDGLAYPYKEILVLRFVEELTIEAIAHTLGIGISAAKMRLSRARSAFETHYEALVTP